MTHSGRWLITAGFLALAAAPVARAQEKTRLDIYGYAMLDAIYDGKQVDPAWFDVLRPTKLPSFKDEFAPDGATYFSVRQTRFGVKSFTPTAMGELKTTFEFELFGTGVDAGQTTFRLRHAYGEIGKFGAGQTWSPFMDIDVFPNSLEYWGPNGMVFFRNLQVRWMPIQGETRATIALERPGASADQGIYAGRIELDSVRPRFPLPDLSGEYRLGQSWGYVELAGMLRRIEWKDLRVNPARNISGSLMGWGLNLSSNVKLGKQSVLRGQVVYGEGIENYMNDAPADVGLDSAKSNLGVALPVLGVVAFLDHNWNDRFSTAIGYSMADIDNKGQPSPGAFKRGQYALGNLLYHPVPQVTTGVEFQWGQRQNQSDGFKSDDFRVQVSFKYNYALSIGGK